MTPGADHHHDPFGTDNKLMGVAMGHLQSTSSVQMLRDQWNAVARAAEPLEWFFDGERRPTDVTAEQAGKAFVELHRAVSALGRGLGCCMCTARDLVFALSTAEGIQVARPAGTAPPG
ncbi:MULTISPECIES: hypothetical protein [unclassified Crossiella]|uniref:hypothetical protein n=1 Tax=unclassified Crossiella TaxID=2620835 RepID=UPI001FFE73CA|nr:MULTISPECIES: hypothetical protein [unclassified Crossiella]MCK2241889.1 hypothetical protein [Crossiella sp. S99.2]MCK2255792.1 hypothetical protein [Crossiella sp. S99.1]